MDSEPSLESEQQKVLPPELGSLHLKPLIEFKTLSKCESAPVPGRRAVTTLGVRRWIRLWKPDDEMSFNIDANMDEGMHSTIVFDETILSLRRKSNSVLLLLFVAGIIVLSITAEKCRQLVGEEASSQSGKFTILNCFDMSSGTLACVVKEGVKLYFYNIRAAHVERARHHAIESALVDAMTQGMSAQDSAKHAQKEGAKAAKLASRKAKRIIGPIISSGWDFFEAIYYGGTITEGFLRGTGTLFGAYAGGFLGEEKLGKVGYLVGSHLGSWVGGRIGLMLYDVVNGVHFLFNFAQTVEIEVQQTSGHESSEALESSFSDETPVYDSSKGSEESSELESSANEEFSNLESSANEESSNLESSANEESNTYESPDYQSSETHEDAELDEFW
ncbi:uncharacterized protein G2W53_044164 [Senna tora]|uniref:Uncharacterized protein n=1 Tax=Senna tora TaxID=362788 RepID=A0A834W0U3_9FABA|nr:uncharacterized protein G2W53_044164 [Senna tora]